jgi:hypothetical protein
VYGAGWVSDFQPLLSSPSIALFLTGCVAHEERGTAGWKGLTIDGVSLRQAFAEWHRGDAVSSSTKPAKPAKMGTTASPGGAPRRHWIDNCSLPCNSDRSLCAPLTASSPLALSPPAPALEIEEVPK